MTPMTIILDGDKCWPDLTNQSGDGMADKVIDGGSIDAMACLPMGTSGGNPSVSVRINLPDGRVVIAQTTLALLLSAGDAFKARHGDPRT